MANIVEISILKWKEPKPIKDLSMQSATVIEMFKTRASTWHSIEKKPRISKT